jgi:hypothetical protein
MNPARPRTSHIQAHEEAQTNELEQHPENIGISSKMKVLVIDVGGTNVKMLATGQQEPRKFPSGPTMTAKVMVAGVKKHTRDWKYDVISVGYPGPVLRGCPRQNRETLLRVGLGSILKPLSSAR